MASDILEFIVYFLAFLVVLGLVPARDWLKKHDRELKAAVIEAERKKPSPLSRTQLKGATLGSGDVGDGVWTSSVYDLTNGYGTIKRFAMRSDQPGTLTLHFSMDNETWDFKKEFAYDPQEETPLTFDDFEKDYVLARYMRITFKSQTPFQMLRIQIL